MAELELTLLDENILDLVLPWFDDDKTRIALGDRDWVRQALQLMETQPGTSEGNLTVNDRVVWVAFEVAQRSASLTSRPTATVRLDWLVMHPCGAGVGQRTTKIVQAAAFEIADNALTRAFVELAGFEPAAFSLRKMRSKRCDHGKQCQFTVLWGGCGASGVRRRETA